MFRTFSQNPSLGGFGGESRSTEKATPDAFCQILKELVDNAVDACTVDEDTPRPKRVRVEIEKYKDSQRNQTDYEVLRVSVSDNGCGMENIEKCVSAFNTSKSRESQPTTATSTSGDAQTAGRYGIGLTLCLLHAQRLVPESCACIQSAVRSDEDWTTMVAVVDSKSDEVRCLPQESRRKGNSMESGTSVSVLLPGGECASHAWPRLAEYFARFRLSLSMRCSLEVLAPTISLVPLFVRPITSALSQKENLGHKKLIVSAKKVLREEDGWRDLLTETGKHSAPEDVSDVESKDAGFPSQDLLALHSAAESYLGKKVPINNVAYHKTPIRIEDSKQSASGPNSKAQKRKKNSCGPQLDVCVIVHGQDNEADNYDAAGQSVQEKSDEEDGAGLVLVRMVNKIPMLDSSEAIACGLVQGLVANKSLWSSFGLNVSLKSNLSNLASCSPSYVVGDTEQVAPFLKRGTHTLLQCGPETSDTLSENTEARKQGKRQLLPAKVRLGNILVVVGIHAQPTTLPLPTLSKVCGFLCLLHHVLLAFSPQGRLPIDSKPVKDALEVGVTKCLQHLQVTNESLLLSATELKRAERDSMYVPAVAMSIASILFKASPRNKAALAKVASWEESGNPESLDDPNIELSFADVTKSIENRLRLVLDESHVKRKANVREGPEEDEASVSTGASVVSLRDFPWKSEMSFNGDNDEEDSIDSFDDF